MAKAKAKNTPAAKKKPAVKKKPVAKHKPVAPAGMKLQLESGKLIKNVKVEQLNDAIAGEQFAILGGGPRSNTYIQTAVQEEAPYLYILEYQDGSTSKHFSAVHDGITLPEIIATFSKYLRGDSSWRDDFTWQRMKL